MVWELHVKRPRRKAKSKQSKGRQKPLPMSRRSKRSKLKTSARSRKKSPSKNEVALPPVQAIPQAAPSQQSEVRIDDELQGKEVEAREEGGELTASEPPWEPTARVLSSTWYREMRQWRWNRWRALANSEAFVLETFQLKSQLKGFIETYPDLLREVLGLMSNTASFAAVQSRIERIVDPTLRALMNRYAAYVVKYGVIFRLDGESPYPRVELIGFSGNKSEAVIRNGELVPVWYPRNAEPGSGQGEVEVPAWDGFESRQLKVPEPIKELVTAGRVRYVEIDDEDEFSLFRQIADLSCSANHATVIRYNAAPQHTFIAVGENVSLDEVWPALRKSLVSYQRDAGKRDRRGRATELRGTSLKARSRPKPESGLYGQLRALVRSGSSLEDIARLFVRDKNSSGYLERLRSKMSRLSQLKNKLREVKFSK
jgi:hypothetical protein